MVARNALIVVVSASLGLSLAVAVCFGSGPKNSARGVKGAGSERASEGAAAENATGEGAAADTKNSAKMPGDAVPAMGQIVIRRQRIHVRPAEKYQVSMHLDPVRTVRLAAPFDGIVKSILHKPGDRLESETEVVRMDTTEKQLLLERAKALYKAAQIENEQTAPLKRDAFGTRLAEARLQAAKADLDLASYRVEQWTIRAPFKSEVFRVEVSEGQVVRMGDPLVTIGDTTSLKVEIPVDRLSTAPAQNVQIKVDDGMANATVDAVLPLAQRFEAIRDLLPSAASAVVRVPNVDGRLKAGQTVFSPLIPRDPVSELPNSCLANVPDGTRKIQVLRNNVIRDVPVATLAPVGPDRIFVSGAFDPSDEVILSTSQELPDGTVVRSMSAAAVAAAQQATQAGPGQGGKGPGAESAPEAPAKRSGL